VLNLSVQFSFIGEVLKGDYSGVNF
jgi:hypothetical protein